MIQCYLIDENENEKINSQETVFELLVKLLDRSIRGLGYNGVNFAVIEVIEAWLLLFQAVSACGTRDPPLTPLTLYRMNIERLLQKNQNFKYCYTII